MRATLLLEPRGAVREQARGVDLGRHVGELPLDRLEVADPAPELLALLRVRARDVERGLRDAERLRGDPDAPAVERRHRDAEAATLLVQQPIALDVRVLDREIRGRRRVEPELLLLARHAHVRCVEDEAGDASRACGARVRAGEERGTCPPATRS